MAEIKIDINIIDQFDPEVISMLQAFYSRNHMPIRERIAEMTEDNTDLKESLAKWLIAYGHKSIGQCGATTLFIEGVSILADKAIQDSRLYAGIETSTRFINFAEQPMFCPELTLPKDCVSGEVIQKRWLDFYKYGQTKLLDHIAKQYNLNLHDDLELKTAKARMFDVLRGFLPAGCTTQLSWFTSFTHASDRLIQLMYHPLQEVREVARAMSQALQVKYPYAFKDFDKNLARYVDYYSGNSLELNYLPVAPGEKWPEFSEVGNSFDISKLRSRKGLDRPAHVPVPRHVQYCGRFQFKFQLDYGSFRDIQRHRDNILMQPVLTTEYGFNTWYLDSLPTELRNMAENLIYKQTASIAALSKLNSETSLQYLIPMGFNVPCLLDLDYPQLVYISELRSSATVHPTLRKVAQKLAQVAKREYVTPVHYDDSDINVVTTRRGQQDIVKK